MVRHVVPPLAHDKMMLGGPGYALAPVWVRTEHGGATIRCMCGHLVELGPHSIDVHGIVSPAFDCPTSTCGWGAELRLEGWA